MDANINSFHIPQDTIKDKLRALSIEVSVAVLSSKRGKRQSALPQLVPVISPSDSKKVLTEVSMQRGW